MIEQCKNFKEGFIDYCNNKIKDLGKVKYNYNGVEKEADVIMQGGVGEFELYNVHIIDNGELFSGVKDGNVLFSVLPFDGQYYIDDYLYDLEFDFISPKFYCYVLDNLETIFGSGFGG